MVGVRLVGDRPEILKTSFEMRPTVRKCKGEQSLESEETLSICSFAFRTSSVKGISLSS